MLPECFNLPWRLDGFSNLIAMEAEGKFMNSFNLPWRLDGFSNLLIHQTKRYNTPSFNLPWRLDGFSNSGLLFACYTYI